MNRIRERGAVNRERLLHIRRKALRELRGNRCHRLAKPRLELGGDRGADLLPRLIEHLGECLGHIRGKLVFDIGPHRLLQALRHRLTRVFCDDGKLRLSLFRVVIRGKRLEQLGGEVGVIGPEIPAVAFEPCQETTRVRIRRLH